MARIMLKSTNFSIHWYRRALLGLMALGLVACGGGGSGGEEVSSYSVTPSAGAGGSISPATAQTVNHGATTSFTITPDTGYSINTVGGTCGGSLSGSTYTSNAIIANCTVQASFMLPAPTNLVATAGSEEVALSWAAVTGATDYCVYTSDTSGIHPDTAASYDSRICTGNTDVSYTVTGLTNDTEYHFIVTASDGSVESAASNEATATPEVPASRPLNDTGITLCGNYAFPNGLNEDHSNSLDCDGVNATTTVAGTDIGGYPVPPGQDAHYGRDAKAMASTLTKTGGGSAGFDFIKVCNSGELAGEGACPNDPALGSSNNEWACTLDNVTGLMWEVKVNELGHLRHRNSTYTWYNPDNVTNGGSVGTPNGGVCTGSDCDTHDFVQAVNVHGLCGATDWRLPSHRELLSIVHNGRVGPSIDTDWFPNASFNWLWSSSPSPAAGFSDYARLIEFNRGGVIESLKNLSTQVRLVRAGQ